MKDAKWAEACPMLEESQRVDPGMGTQFQLAKCYEGQGRVASAWIQYVDVADSAKASGQGDKEKAARARADAVAPRVPKLQIDLAAGDAAAEVKRDGTIIPKIQWGVPLPVDPGKHTVTATATGKKPFEASVDVKEGQIVKLAVPELQVGPATPVVVPPPVVPPPSPPPPAEQPDPGGSRKTAALVVGGVGVAAFGVGVVLGLVAKSKQDGVGADCSGDRCDSAGVDARKSAVSTANVGSIVGGVGLLAIAGGAVLWLTAPTAPKSAYVAPTPGGLSMGGRF